jgi:hypothetical protein
VRPNSADFAPTSIVHEHMKKIGNSVALVSAARAGQSLNRVTKASLLDALLLDLKRIAATARAIELRSGETGFAVPYNKASSTAVITGAAPDSPFHGSCADRKGEHTRPACRGGRPRPPRVKTGAAAHKLHRFRAATRV